MRRRILFVEDNPVLRELYGMMLSGEAGRWEPAVVGSGEEALKLMENQAFDVIVSDMRLPGMDGVQLIREVKQRHPRTSRIVLSGVSDQKEIAECLGTTHQFLAKPLDAKALKATLTRLCGLDAYLQDETLQSLAARLGTLPSFPSLYLEIMQELASGNASVESIAKIIAQDPAMTAKMLQIANSAAFGLARRVSSPFDAVQYLGIGTVRSLALSLHVFAAFEKTELRGFSITAQWDHAIKTAVLARAILRDSDGEADDAEDAYTAGILHDMGKMLLAANVPVAFQQALNLSRERQVPLHEAEQEVLGATHAGVGSYLLGLWGLPASIVEAVAFHHVPGRSEAKKLDALAAVHVANELDHERGGLASSGSRAGLDTAYLSAIGVEDRLDAWRAEAGGSFGPRKN
jgi:HD-like signal output (HDOD) protein